MKRQLLCSVVAAGAAAGLAACGGQPEDEYRDAVPHTVEIALKVPGGQLDGDSARRTSALDAERAALYELTREVSTGLNGALWFGLQLVDEITDHPPTSLVGRVATWGPYTPALEPLTWTLVVRRTGAGQFGYVLAARPKSDTDGEFRPVIAGKSTRGPSTTFSGYYGVFTANATALNELDPAGHTDTGAIVATYDTRGDERRVKLALKDYSEADGQKSSAVYAYVERADGSGDMRFVAHTDVDENGSSNELAAVHTAWNPTGAGRGQAAITGGDVPEGVVVMLVECWDEAFSRAYYEDNLDLDARFGDASDCVLGPLPE